MYCDRKRDGNNMEYADLIWDIDEIERKKFIDNLAPIVLFTYNRLKHTKQTIEALLDNIYAEHSRLYIYSDGPKNEESVEKVQEVRDYLHTIAGFKEIVIVEREKNWGLAENIIDGVTEIVNEYGKIIVLEDDIVTSKYFLKYMNDALEIYKDEPKVMEISGYMYPLKDNKDLPETWFVHRFADCWGWATWARSWQYFERNPQKLIEEFSKKDIMAFNFDGNYDFWKQIEANAEGNLYTWAVFWQATVFKQDGYMLAVSNSMTRNAGFDKTGEHCGKSDSFNVPLAIDPVMHFPVIVKEKAIFRDRLTVGMVNSGGGVGLLRRLLKKIEQLLRSRRIIEEK